MMKPRIGIPIPTSIDLPYNQRSWPSYAEGVARSGGEPVEIPLTHSPDELEALAATCHGFLLPGSPADVDPGLYDTPRLPECGPQDLLREQTDFALLAYAAATGKPLLGICYGCQSMNVFHGGSLIQDLSPLPVNHSAGASVAVAHSVLLDPNSTLAATLLAFPDTPTELSSRPESAHFADAAERPAASSATQLRLPVNTSHHQSVAVVGRGLRIVARCPDDEVIEAIEIDPAVEQPRMFHVEHSPGAAMEPEAMFHVEHRPGEPSAQPRFPSPSLPLLLGVQWHPERSLDISPASRALFHHLILEAQRFAPAPRT